MQQRPAASFKSRKVLTRRQALSQDISWHRSNLVLPPMPLPIHSPMLEPLPQTRSPRYLQSRECPPLLAPVLAQLLTSPHQ